MDAKEMESLVKQLKAAGLSEDQIMDTFFETFKEGKMDRKDLEACAEFMGYELTDEFKNDPTPDPIEENPVPGAEGITKEEAENAKEIKPGESPEEFKGKIEDEGAPAPAPEKPENSDEDKEWEEVQKKFKW